MALDSIVSISLNIFIGVEKSRLPIYLRIPLPSPPIVLGPRVVAPSIPIEDEGDRSLERPLKHGLSNPLVSISFRPRSSSIGNRRGWIALSGEKSAVLTPFEGVHRHFLDLSQMPGKKIDRRRKQKTSSVVKTKSFRRKRSMPRVHRIGFSKITHSRPIETRLKTKRERP